ncbi:MAG TPA: efflux RND transporter periplasmic adaptor subunit [Sedimentisphaerales bacterium]|nr:efflux RND transporter periplasmic adaptor subunit [Sedimentisphaerales bacterium]HRS11610.1 efflux RND transporter periplasmic adaptor subunit [Sedimentisphaerales bacterium]HRV48273.1 efflux RND transporter periplasmic adaptor subunit [Sedimentisphaerales bacterium]
MVRSARVLVILLVIVLVLGVLGGGGFVLVRGRGSAANKATVVRVEEARIGELIEIVSAPGEIEPKINVEISAKTSGRIVELPYAEGATVTKGDPDADPPIPPSVLVRLDAKDLESRLLSAQASRAAQAAQIEVEKARISSQAANLMAQEATVEKARRDYERQCALLRTNDVSQVTCDDARFKLEELESQLEGARHNLEAARLNLKVLEHNLQVADEGIAQAKEALSYTTITSPIDGVITRINAEVGEMVVTGMMNNPGTKILEVGDLSEMLVVAQVDESDVGKLRVGQAARVHIQAWPDKVFPGKVRAIALSQDVGTQGAKYYETEVLLIDPSERIFTGMTADVDIEVAKHEEVLVLPSQAVLGREVDSLPIDIRDQLSEEERSKTFATVVYRFIDGKAVITPVRIGASNATHTIIEAGISPGEKIIVGPFKELEKLQHNQSVKDEREAKAEEDAKNRTEKAPAGDSRDVNNVQPSSDANAA